jgi:hypothetical protein
VAAALPPQYVEFKEQIRLEMLGIKQRMGERRGLHRQGYRHTRFVHALPRRKLATPVAFASRKPWFLFAHPAAFDWWVFRSHRTRIESRDLASVNLDICPN